AMLTQGESALPVRSLANVAARASGPLSTKANDNPAAPIITWRREIEVLFKDVVAIFVVVMARPPARHAQPRARSVDRFRNGSDSLAYGRRSSRVSAWDSAGASRPRSLFVQTGNSHIAAPARRARPSAAGATNPPTVLRSWSRTCLRSPRPGSGTKTRACRRYAPCRRRTDRFRNRT